MKNKKAKIIIIIVLVLILVGIGVALFITTNGLQNLSKKIATVSEEVKLEKPNIKIFSGNERPIAVMIDNNTNAWPQAAVNQAYIIYEIIVEGGETRLMALFKGADADSIGPIRSSRHYFLDYAMENDAIYAHLGWSPQAQGDISALKINNINGQAYDTGKARTADSLYWRAKNKKAPHNAYTSIASLKKISEKLGYRTTSDKSSVLNYVSKEISFENNESAKNANSVTITYGNSNKVNYTYNEETKRYEKQSKGKKQSDEITGEVMSAKNIILTVVENYTLNDGENKGRQGLKNIGTSSGFYITNGKAIDIICKKDDRSSQTKYTDIDGNEIEVNDGNTFINICQSESAISIE